MIDPGLKYGFPKRGIKPIIDPAKRKYSSEQYLDVVKKIPNDVVAAHAVIRPKIKRPMRLSPLGGVLPPKRRSSPGGSSALARTASAPSLPATPAPPKEVAVALATTD